MALENINWSIIGISEVRRMGDKIEDYGDFVLYSKGETPGQYGVGFMIHKELKHNIVEVQGISERIAVLKIMLPLHKNEWTIVQVYSPTEQSSDSTINEFYKKLNDTLTKISPTNLILMGDFNAQIGNRRDGEEIIMGPHYQGKRTRNGQKLIDLAFEQHLVILNSIYKKKQNRRWTWSSPDGRYKNEIDYILTNRARSFEDCNVIAKLNFNTNHRMVRTQLKPTPIKSTRKFTKHQKDIMKNNEPQLTNKQVEEELMNMDEDLSEWNILEIYNKLANILSKYNNGKMRFGKGKDILSEKTKQIMENRAKLLETSPKTAEIRRVITQLSKELRTNMRKDRKDHRLRTLENLIEKTGGTKKAMKLLQGKEQWIPKLKNSFGKDKTKRPDIISTATDYYSDLYSKKSSTEQIELPDSDKVPSIMQSEVEKAISTQKRDKALGPDNISNEAILETKEIITPLLTKIFNIILETEKIPKSWTVSSIKLLHKKGNRDDIGNYRPISLMSNMYKVFSKIILNRITKTLDENQPREQAGFRNNYSTVDHIHVARQIAEKCKEYNIHYHCCFVDYCKAFDSLDHSKIWKALLNQGVEHKYIRIIKNIYTGTTARIKLEKEGCDINIQRGVRQGDPLSPKLFTAVLEEVFRKFDWSNNGLNINGEKLTHLRFADDIVVFASTARELQQMLVELNTASKAVGLSMNLQKTKAMTTNSMEATEIKIDDNTIEYVTEYIYLGQLISNHDSTTKEIDRRIGNAWKRYWSLKEVMKNSQTSMHIKRKLFNTCILPIFTYGCQTWALTKAQCKRLSITQRAMERSILKRRRIDKTSNKDLRDKTGFTDVTYKTKQLKWKWAGHTIRGGDKWSKIVTLWHPRGHKRNR